MCVLIHRVVWNPASCVAKTILHQNFVDIKNLFSFPFTFLVFLYFCCFVTNLFLQIDSCMVCLEKRFRDLLLSSMFERELGHFVVFSLCLCGNTSFANCILRSAVNHIDLQDTHLDLAFSHLPAAVMTLS